MPEEHSLSRFAGFYYCLHLAFSAECQPEIPLKVIHNRRTSCS